MVRRPSMPIKDIRLKLPSMDEFANDLIKSCAVRRQMYGLEQDAPGFEDCKLAPCADRCPLKVDDEMVTLLMDLGYINKDGRSKMR